MNRRMLENYISELGSFCKSKETFVHVHNLIVMRIIIRKIKGLFYLSLKLISFITSKCKIRSDNIEYVMKHK